MGHDSNMRSIRTNVRIAKNVEKPQEQRNIEEIMSTTRLPQTSVSTASSATQSATRSPAGLASRSASSSGSRGISPSAQNRNAQWQPASRTGHLTARGRRLLTILVALPVIGASVFLGGQVAHAIGAGSQTSQIVVKTGESLWDVAKKVAPNSDPREVIWTIQQLNHMKTSVILDGQTLTVPNLNR